MTRFGLLGFSATGVGAMDDEIDGVQWLAAVAGGEPRCNLERQAFMLDPLTGAVCNPPEIWQLVDDMLVAQAEWLPQYGEAIAAAEERIAAGGRIKVREGYEGAARLHTRTVEEMAKDRDAANQQAGEADKAQERPAASDKE